MEIVNQTKHISKRMNTENKWVVIYAFVLCLIITIPYWVGFQNQGDEWKFTGFVFGVEDGNTYIGKMLRGAQGDWLFQSPFSAIEQRGTFIFLPYLLLGKLTAPPSQHDQLVVLYHLFRLIGVILAVFATYDFLTLYIQDKRIRRIGLILITLGGGLGWLLVLLGQNNWFGSLPIDFYSPETFGFLGSFGIAHLPWARAFFLWGIRTYLLKNQMNENEYKPFISFARWNPGVLWLLTGIAQPITGVVVGIVVGYHLLGVATWQIIQESKFNRFDHKFLQHYIVVASQAGLVALPLVIYNILVFNLDPYLKIWVEQSRIPAPHFLHYLVASGLILPFSIWGVKSVMKMKPHLGVFLVAWVALMPVTLTIPFSLQRRLVEGAWVALVTLALVAFERSTHIWFKRFYFLLILTLPTTLILLIGGLGSASNITTPVFRPTDEVSAFRFLADTADEDSVVLCSYQTGNALPAWAPVFVIIGHRPESAGYADLAPKVEAFYHEDTLNDSRLSLLSSSGADYVFWGPHERRHGDWNPSSAQYLELVFSVGEYQVYRVTPSEITQ